MNQSENYSKRFIWFFALLLTALIAGCGGGGSGGRSPILGSGGATLQLPPTVTAVAPVNGASGVPLGTLITVAFSEPMDPTTVSLGSNFTLACVAVPACTQQPAVTGVTFDSTGTIATFTTSGLSAAPVGSTSPYSYTATVTGAKSKATGLPMTSPFIWHFTTAVTRDTTMPQVTLTVPATTSPGPTLNVPTNTAITAVFTKDMAPATISATSFTLTCATPCTNPSGTVSYSVGSRTAAFTPTAALQANTTYTATVTKFATDLSGNQLAGISSQPLVANDYVWTFTTAAATTPAAPISIGSTNPISAASGVCPNASINATFTVPSGLRMDPTTVTTTTFTVAGPGTTPVLGTVGLDTATGTIATFTPASLLTSGVQYTATITGGANGVKDLAIPANTMTNNYTWTFTAGPATGACLAPVALNSASTYGTFGGTAGMTNTGTLTVINGDIGTKATATSSVTGFNDTAGDIYTETPANIGQVNGTIYTCTVSTSGPTSGGVNATYCSDAGQAWLDAQTAYNALVAEPSGGVSPQPPTGNLAGLTLLPGVYTAPSGSYMIQGGNLTLDAQGNANAVWVFQMATTLAVGGPGATAPQSIILANGAQAKNVFWQVGSAATINAAGGGTMVGTIISQAGAAFSTAGNVALVTLNGRVLSLGASVTLVDTVINVPAP